MAKNQFISSIIAVIMVGITASAFAQPGVFKYPEMTELDPEDVNKISNQFSMFSTDKILKLAIQADFKELMKNKFDDKERPAFYTYMLNDTILVRDSLKISPRGNFRRKYCTLPPVKLNFEKSDYLIRDQKKFDKMKMVSVCRQSKTYQQYIFKEYLVYKLYNLFTDYSYKARMIQLSYIDTSEKFKPDSTYGFIIEPTDMMAKRNDAIEIETKVPHQELTDREVINLVATFNFMVGNLDWSVPGQHNIKLIKVTDPKKPRPIAIPYDFDFCGFVNTTYAHPPPKLDAETVRDRIFRGYPRTEEEREKAFDLFREKKDAVFSLIENDPYLSSSVKKDVSLFVKEFYEIIDSDYQVNRYFVQGARSDN